MFVATETLKNVLKRVHAYVNIGGHNPHAMLLNSILKTLSNGDQRPRPSHTVHVHTLYLLWGVDVTTLKVFDLTEPQKQPRQHIHLNMPQSNILNTSVNGSET